METILLFIMAGWLIYQCLSSVNYTELQDEPYYFILETPDAQLESYLFERGYGNGYVRVSERHPLYNKNYYDHENELGAPENLLEVHGGITYSGFIRRKDEFVFGFDTSHYGDNKRICSAEYVHSECQRLLEQIRKIY